MSYGVTHACINLKAYLHFQKENKFLYLTHFAWVSYILEKQCFQNNRQGNVIVNNKTSVLALYWVLLPDDFKVSCAYSWRNIASGVILIT